MHGAKSQIRESDRKSESGREKQKYQAKGMRVVMCLQVRTVHGGDQTHNEKKNAHADCGRWRESGIGWKQRDERRPAALIRMGHGAGAIVAALQRDKVYAPDELR